MQESFQAALAALGLAVIFIYLILASQFASFTQPIAIMASLPFSLIGVFLALLLTGTTLNLFSIIGFIMLMGLVTKNAILLVDFANRARRGGASLHDALLTAGPGAPAPDPDDDRGDDRRHDCRSRSASAKAARRRRRWAARSSAASSPRRC